MSRNHVYDRYLLIYGRPATLIYGMSRNLLLYARKEVFDVYFSFYKNVAAVPMFSEFFKFQLIRSSVYKKSMNR